MSEMELQLFNVHVSMQVQIYEGGMVEMSQALSKTNIHECFVGSSHNTMTLPEPHRQGGLLHRLSVPHCNACMQC